MFRMSSHSFLGGGGTETKSSSCTVISSICCAVRVPINGVKLSETTTNFFPVLALETFKWVVPRGFISFPFRSSSSGFCLMVLRDFLWCEIL